jgi:predicted MFS family arabinose efflux permease
MLRLIIFIIAPLAIASLFFEYFLPVYAVKAGIGSADIGRAFLINGLAIAYGAPLVGKYFAARISERVSVFLFTALMAAGFLAFGFTGGLAGILIASAVMGIAEGAALVSQTELCLTCRSPKRQAPAGYLAFIPSSESCPRLLGRRFLLLLC